MRCATSPAEPVKRPRWSFSSSKRRVRQVSPVACSAIRTRTSASQPPNPPRSPASVGLADLVDAAVPAGDWEVALRSDSGRLRWPVPRPLGGARAARGWRFAVSADRSDHPSPDRAAHLPWTRPHRPHRGLTRPSRLASRRVSTDLGESYALDILMIGWHALMHANHDQDRRSAAGRGQGASSRLGADAQCRRRGRPARVSLSPPA